VQIEHPIFLLMLPLILGLIFVKPKVKLGTIIWSNIQFVKQANSQVKYKHRDWLFVLRLCSMAAITFSLCGISIGGATTSFFLVKFAIFATLGEIFLRNTVLRTLP
jgi:hypothetical protein